MGEKLTKGILQYRIMDEIDSELKALNQYAVGDDEKKRGVENVEKLYKLLQADEDQRLKEQEQELKLKAEKRKSVAEGVLKAIGFVVEGAAIVIPAKTYWEVAKATFVFEKEDCITSSFGKTLPRLLSPKKII